MDAPFMKGNRCCRLHGDQLSEVLVMPKRDKWRAFTAPQQIGTYLTLVISKHKLHYAQMESLVIRYATRSRGDKAQCRAVESTMQRAEVSRTFQAPCHLIDIT